MRLLYEIKSELSKLSGGLYEQLKVVDGTPVKVYKVILKFEGDERVLIESTEFKFIRQEFMYIFMKAEEEII